MGILPIQPINPRKIIIVKEGIVVQKEREEKDTLLILQKENMRVLIVMVYPPLEEKGKKNNGILQGEFWKIKDPTYEGDMNTRDKAEEWLLGMSKFFWVHNYSSEMKSQLDI